MHDHPELLRKYMGSVVPVTDNYFAALNSAVFTDGSFVYVPDGTFTGLDSFTYQTKDSDNVLGNVVAVTLATIWRAFLRRPFRPFILPLVK